MKNIIVLLFVGAWTVSLSASEIVYGERLSLVQKSEDEVLREEFERIIGKFDSFEYLLIYPNEKQISGIKSTPSGITRVYWRNGIRESLVESESYGIEVAKKVRESTGRLEKICDLRKQNQEVFEEFASSIYLFVKKSGKWKCIRIKVESVDKDYQYICQIMLPKTDMPSKEDVDDFFESRDKPKTE